MDELEWIAKYKKEIWVPKRHQHKNAGFMCANGRAFMATQPVRLIGNQISLRRPSFEFFDRASGAISMAAISDPNEFCDVYELLSEINKVAEEEKTSKIAYRVREMFIPDDSFVKGRMCLGIIAAPDNAGTDENRIYCEEFYNAQFDSYFRDEEIFHNLIHFMSQWIWHVKSYWRKEPAGNPFLVPFDKRYGGVYISSRDTVVEFEYQAGKNPVFQISKWVTDYFEQVNKKKEDIKNEN